MIVLRDVKLRNIGVIIFGFVILIGIVGVVQFVATKEYTLLIVSGLSVMMYISLWFIIVTTVILKNP